MGSGCPPPRQLWIVGPGCFKHSCAWRPLTGWDPPCTPGTHRAPCVAALGALHTSPFSPLRPLPVPQTQEQPPPWPSWFWTAQTLSSKVPLGHLTEGPDPQMGAPPCPSVPTPHPHPIGSAQDPPGVPCQEEELPYSTETGCWAGRDSPRLLIWTGVPPVRDPLSIGCFPLELSIQGHSGGPQTLPQEKGCPRRGT